MNKFEQAEQKGREKFTVYCQETPGCKVERFAKNKMSRWDVAYVHLDAPMVGEIKNRAYNHDDFNDWYLEEDKYQALKTIQSSLTVYTNIVYINHFKDGVTLEWTLNAIDFTKIEKSFKWLQVNDYSTEWKWKTVYHLPIDMAVKYGRKLDLE